MYLQVLNVLASFECTCKFRMHLKIWIHGNLNKKFVNSSVKRFDLNRTCKFWMHLQVSNVLGSLRTYLKIWIRANLNKEFDNFSVKSFILNRTLLFNWNPFTSRIECCKCTHKLWWLANDLFANSRHMRLRPRQDWTNYMLLRVMPTHSLTHLLAHSQCFLICCLLLMRYICPLRGRTQDLRASCSIVCSSLLALVTHQMQNVMKFCCKLWL